MTDQQLNNTVRLEGESYDDWHFRLWASGTIQPQGITQKEQQENHQRMMSSYQERHRNDPTR